MGFLDWLLKTDRPRYLMSFQKPGDAVYWDRTYDNFSKEGYQKNVIVFRCVDMIATAAAGIPWCLYKVAGRKRKAEIEEGPVLDLIDKPNPKQYGPDFIGAMVAYRMIAGNSYVLAVGPEGDAPRELWPLMPNWVKVIPGSKSLPMSYRYGTSATDYTFYPVDQLTGKSDVLHMKNFHPTNPWYGMSAIEAAAASVDQHNASGKWNASLLQNAAMPSGALVVAVSDKNPTGKLGDQQYIKLKQDIEDRQTGPRNAGRPMLLEGGLEWKQMSMSPKDMDWVNCKDTSARDICFAFGVPAQLIGIPGDNTYANYETARLAFYEETVLPLMDKLQADLNGWLMPRFGSGLSLGYDKDEIEALEPKRKALWDKVNASSELTVNEKRHAKGYDPLDPEDGGDEILVPSSMTTLEAISMDAENVENEGQDDLDIEDQGEGSSPEEGDDDETEGSGKSHKSFNHTSKAKKTREWKRQNRLRRKFMARMASQVSAQFKVEGASVAHALDGLSDHAAQIAAAHLVAKHADTWRGILTRNIQAAARAFGKDVIEQAKHMKGFVESKTAETRFDSFLEFWIKNYVGERITDLEETTRTQVIKAIRKAHAETVSEGEGFVSLADKIEDLYDGFSKGRARTIARTEIGTASNYASYQAAKATGLRLQKEWVARDGGSESRPTHQDVNGTIIPMDQKFDVGDYEMVSPGDPVAGPEEICNCYCILIYSTESE